VIKDDKYSVGIGGTPGISSVGTGLMSASSNKGEELKEGRIKEMVSKVKKRMLDKYSSEDYYDEDIVTMLKKNLAKKYLEGRQTKNKDKYSPLFKYKETKKK
jgi:hypothetical protein